jgi:Fe-S oxidoreductase
MLRSGRAAPDEATVRADLTSQFDACDACRACVSYCAAFPLMFDLIHVVADPARSAGDLTVAEQDRITDACTRCGRCVEACGYGYDVPALADRGLAMRRATGQLSWRRRATDLLAGFGRKPAP